MRFTRKDFHIYALSYLMALLQLKRLKVVSEWIENKYK